MSAATHLRKCIRLLLAAVLTTVASAAAQAAGHGIHQSEIEDQKSKIPTLAAAEARRERIDRAIADDTRVFREHLANEDLTAEELIRRVDAHQSALSSLRAQFDDATRQLALQTRQIGLTGPPALPRIFSADPAEAALQRQDSRLSGCRQPSSRRQSLRQGNDPQRRRDSHSQSRAHRIAGTTASRVEQDAICHRQTSRSARHRDSRATHYPRRHKTVCSQTSDSSQAVSDHPTMKFRTLPIVTSV